MRNIYKNIILIFILFCSISYSFSEARNELLSNNNQNDDNIIKFMLVNEDLMDKFYRDDLNSDHVIKNFDTSIELYENLISHYSNIDFEYIEKEDIVIVSSADNNPEKDSYAYKFGLFDAKGWIFLYNKIEMDGNHIENPRIEKNTNNASSMYSMVFDLDDEGIKIFSELTGNNINNRLAIVINKNVITAPIISDKISDGGIKISGCYSKEEWEKLLELIKSGIDF